MSDNKGMKLSILLLFTLISVFQVNAMDSSTPGDGIGNVNTDNAPVYQSELAHTGSEECGDDDVACKTESLFMNDPKLKSLYDKCTTDDATKTDDPGDCVWAQLDDSEKENYIKMLEVDQSNSNQASGDEEKKKYDSVNITKVKYKKNDPAVQAMANFFKQHIEKGVYGDKKDGTKTVADHKVFNDMYKSRVSKNILEAISSFCVEAEPKNYTYTDPNTNQQGTGTYFEIPSSPTDRERVRKQNVEKLAKATTQGSGDSQTKTTEATSQYTLCMTQLQDICHGKALTGNHTPSYNTETKGRACRVTNYIKGNKQVLMAMEKMEEAYQNNRTSDKGIAICKTDKDNPGRCLESGTAERYTGKVDGDKKRNLERLTTLSSKQAVEGEYEDDDGNKVSFKSASEELLKKYKECTEGGNQELCEQIVTKNKKEKMKLLGDISIKTKIMEAKLDSDKFDENEAKIYLKEQGYSDEQISKAIENGFDDLKKEIVEKYKKERENIVASLRDEIDDKYADEDDKPDEVKNKVAEIQKEMTKRVDSYQQLIHFNNVVTAFLQVEDSSGGLSRNTASFEAEMEDAYVNPDDQAASEDYNTRLREVAGNVVGDDESNEGDGAVTFGVKDINSNVLDYDSMKGEEQ